jgi:transposase-like protein
MSDDKNNKIATKEFLSERDMRIFKLRQSGVSTNEIARRFGVTTSVVSKAIQRQLEKMNRETLLAYPEVLRLELERLDNLQQAIWPLTQHRKVRLDDGTEIPVEPDLRAVAEVRAIMGARAKLLGMEQTSIQIQVEDQTPQRAALAGADRAAGVNDFSAETEARKMLEVMAAAGILPDETVNSILSPMLEIEAEND